jgi:hypothetical protein
MLAIILADGTEALIYYDEFLVRVFRDLSKCHEIPTKGSKVEKC